jgi:FixJ family two-component response regulator
MTGLSGFALGSALAAAQPGLPIVFMSGVEIPQDPENRFREFLKKPFDLREIQCKLHDVLTNG